MSYGEDELLREHIKTQIGVIKDFTRELVDVYKLLQDIKEIDNKVLQQLQNGLSVRIENKFREMLETQKKDIAESTCDIVYKRVRDLNSRLFLKLLGASSILAAIFGFVVYVISIISSR